MSKPRSNSIVLARPTGALVMTWLAVCLSAALAPADPPSDGPASPIRVAVIDFQVDLPGEAELGPQVADVLAAQLSVWQMPELIDRQELTDVMSENRLTVSGFLDETLAAKTGQLVGADLLIMGKVFKANETIMIVTKITSVQTGRMVGLLNKVDPSRPLAEALASVAEKVQQVLREQADSLLPAGVPLADVIAPMRKVLRTKHVPGIAMVVTGRPDTSGQPPQAAGVAIRELLEHCGIMVVIVAHDELGEWVSSTPEAQAAAWPAVLEEVDMIVIAQGRSEPADSVNGLSCAVGEIALRVVHRTGQTVLTDRETQSAVGFTDDSAAEIALHKAARRLAIRLVSHLAETLPEASRVEPDTHHRSDSVADEPTGSDP